MNNFLLLSHLALIDGVAGCGHTSYEEQNRPRSVRTEIKQRRKTQTTSGDEYLSEGAEWNSNLPAAT